MNCTPTHLLSEPCGGTHIIGSGIASLSLDIYKHYNRDCKSGGGRKIWKWMKRVDLGGRARKNDGFESGFRRKGVDENQMGLGIQQDKARIVIFEISLLRYSVYLYTVSDHLICGSISTGVSLLELILMELP